MLMKKLHWILCLLGLSLAGFAQPGKVSSMDNPAVPTKNKVGKRIATFLKKEQVKLLKRPDKVMALKVKSFKSDKKDLSKLIEGYEILQKKTLTKLQHQKIRRLLGSDSTYLPDSLAKLCLFLPEFGIRLTDKKDTTNVLISLKCDLIRFYHQGKYKMLNCDPARDELRAFYQEIFKESTTTSMSQKMSSKPIYYTVEAGDGWFVVSRKALKVYKRNASMKNIKQMLTKIYKWNDIKQVNAQEFPHIDPGDKIIVGYQSSSK